MEKELNTLSDDKILRDWIDTLPIGKYNKIINLLVERCLVNRTTFRNWRYGNCRIPMAAKRDINSVTREISGFDIFKIALPANRTEGASDVVTGSAI